MADFQCDLNPITIIPSDDDCASLTLPELKIGIIISHSTYSATAAVAGTPPVTPPHRMRINLCNSQVCPRGEGLLLHSTSNNNFIRPIRRGGLTAITMDTVREQQHPAAEEDWPFLGGGDATTTTTDHHHHHTLACAHSRLSTFDVNRWSHSLWPCTIATISPC